MQSLERATKIVLVAREGRDVTVTPGRSTGASSWIQTFVSSSSPLALPSSRLLWRASEALSGRKLPVRRIGDACWLCCLQIPTREGCAICGARELLLHVSAAARPDPDLRIQALDWRHTFFADGVPARLWQCWQAPGRRRGLRRGEARKSRVAGRRRKDNGQEIRNMGEKEMCCTTQYPVSLLWFRLRCDRHPMTPSL